MTSASLVSRIFYRSLYVFLNLILVVLLLLIPADVIHQSISHSQSYNILVIALSYIVTIIIVAFIYAIRLYINRSNLASIPKTWIPIEKGDINKHVRKIIVAGLSRSAAIAYEARPRVPLVFPERNSEYGGEDAQSEGHEEEKKSQRIFRLRKAATVEDEMGISLPPHKSVWGDIEHPGWASPTSPKLPNLEYAPVILELPNLIEVKAVTLAPPAREVQGERPTLDPEIVSLLQRPESMGLREYLSQLGELRVLENTQAVPGFIAKYEFARFSNRPISNADFDDLMHLFAEILRTMHPLDPTVLDEASSYAEGTLDSSMDDTVSLGTNSFTRRARRRRDRRPSASSNLTRSASSSTASSRLRRPSLPLRNSSANTGLAYRTAPTTPKSRQTALSRSSSANTFAQTRQPYHPDSSSSGASLRSQSSVIRLSEPADATDLPYVLTLTNSR